LEEHAVTLERIRTAAEGALKGFQIVNNFIFINVLLAQYSMKIDTKGEIVQDAKTGQIHPSLLSPSELLEQFKDIKLGLPSGADLSIELDLENSYKLLKLSELAVYYNNDHLVFKISITLV
jgi:hypothetical protein